MSINKLSLFCILFGVAFACIYDEGNTKTRGEHIRGVHWDYKNPAGWGGLDSSYAACSNGHKQTPVNINFKEGATKATKDYQIGKLHFKKSVETNAAVTHNGHTVVVDGKASPNTVSGGPFLGDEYTLLQFHFHAPSEHTFNGVQYPLEVHFVHNNTQTGDLGVIGLLFKKGKENKWLKNLFLNLPSFDENTSVQSPSSVSVTINSYSAFPEDKSYFHYMGSLTTPPCSEGLKWVVMKQVVEVSEEQLKEWEVAVEGSSARPVQGLNGRTLFFDNEGEAQEPDVIFKRFDRDHTNTLNKVEFANAVKHTNGFVKV